MSTLVKDELTALEDLLASCYGAIYAYGVVAAYLSDPEEALNAMAAFRIHRDQLLTSFDELGYPAPAASAAYSITPQVLDDPSARVAAALLEENAIAHWANALFTYPLRSSNGNVNFYKAAQFDHLVGLELPKRLVRLRKSLDRNNETNN